MSISPISSSMMSMYVAGAASFSGAKDEEYELIKQALKALGISITGDKTADKARLQTAKKMKEMSQSQGSSSTKQSIPFDDVMNTLNLKITGDIEKDYRTTVDRLDYEIGMASSEENKSYFQALKYQVETEYNQSKQNSVSNFSGASQISSLNRYMLGI